MSQRMEPKEEMGDRTTGNRTGRQQNRPDTHIHPSTVLAEPEITFHVLPAPRYRGAIPERQRALSTGRLPCSQGGRQGSRTVSRGPVRGTRLSNSLADQDVRAACSHMYYVHLQNLKENKCKKNTTERNLGCRFLPRRHHKSQGSPQFSRAGRRARRWSAGQVDPDPRCMLGSCVDTAVPQPFQAWEATLPWSGPGSDRFWL